MKTLLVLALIIFGFTANAKTYYLSNSGNDSNSGTDPSSPWQTLNKLNSFKSFAPGDNILFNRGDTFYGSITVSNSGSAGNPITYGAYGSGANPVITALTTVSSWSNLGSNIWESTSTLPASLQPNIVVINGVLTPMGRWPNTGWNNNTSATPTSLTASALSSGTWTGAEIVTKDQRYIIIRRKITSQSGSTVNFASAAYPPQSGWGYFIQNSLATLDVQNEWFYNMSTQKIDVYSTTSPTGVKVSTVETLVSLLGINYITFDGIDFEGANKNSFVIGYSNHVTIQNSNINFCGDEAVSGQNWGTNSTYLTVQNCSFNNNINNAIDIPSEFLNAYVGHNTFYNTGMIEGMGGSTDQQGMAIHVAGNNTTVEYNNVDSTGYTAVYFDGSNVTINNNFINYYNLIKDDGGGIYTYANNGFTGRVVKSNIVLNGIGYGGGTNNPTGQEAHGIYMDGYTNDVSILNNSVSGASYAGIFLQGNSNMNVRGNTIYDSKRYSILFTYTATNIISRNNIFVAKTSIEMCLSSGNIAASASNYNLDSNYYARPIDDNQVFYTDFNSGTYNIASWKTYSKIDAHSNKSPKSVTSTDSLRFEYNANSSSKIVSLGANYIDVKGQSYNGSITLAPYTSAILIRNGSLSGNQPPTADAGPNQSITLPTNSISLSGSGNDPDGTISSYLWTKISGPSTYTIANPSSAATNVSGLVQGSYTFQLKVTDNGGATGIDTVQVTVNASTNQPPTASAGGDQSITLPTNNVSLSGSGSDPDGTITSYLWTKISGPSTYTIVNPSSAATNVSGLVQGNYTFQLKVTDNGGATGIDTVQVTVNASSNQPPTADAGSNQSITLPISSVTLSGSGSDADGTISSYLWTKISGPSTFNIVSPSSAVSAVTNLVQGAYTFQLKVTDNNGATGIDTVHVTVNPAANIPPTADAGSDQTITLPANTVSLFGSGSDADGTVSSYLWTKISGPSTYNIVDPSSAVTDVSGLVQGTYQFQLKVIDNNGATAVSNMQVTVNAAANMPPTANAGTNQTITLPANIVSLSGSGSDADGTIASYLWTIISGPSTYNIVTPASAVTNVSELVQGVYKFRLTVTDNNGASASSTVQVTVNAAPNMPPTASAGTDKTITLPANSTTIYGSGSDADGTIVSYNWTKISGPSAGTIANATSASTGVSGLVQGIYQFEFKVTDNQGAVGKDTMMVTVNAAPNIPPTSDAGPDKTITLPTNTVSLSGSGSDADGTIASYSWTKISGPSAYNIVSPSSAITDISGMVQGVYQFQLKVTDNNGASASSNVQVTVNAANNLPPVANAGPDKAITLPTNTVSLSGSGSDADGTISIYLWTKISGPSSYNIVNSSSPVTDVSGLVQGVYKFRLTVTDNNGASASATMQVTVNAAPNMPPTASAGTDKTITLPINSTTLYGSGSDADGTIVSYSWTKISGPSAGTIGNATSASTSLSGLVQGIYQFEFRVTDNQGAVGKDTLQVTVNAAPNIPPTSDAGGDKTITLPVNTVSLSGSGSDADGTISSYLWTKISGPSAYNIVNPASPVTDVSGLVQGVYQFQLKVTDNKGASSTSNVQVTVNVAANIPPTANAGTNQTITLPTNTTSLSGSGSDADGTIKSYLWTKISGPSAYNIVNSSSPVTDVSGMVQGVYKFRLTVTDNNGASASATMQVTVNAAANIAPTANAGSNKNITLPTNSVNLTGSGSDADGTIASYQWTKISGPSSYNIASPNSASTNITGLVQGVYQFQLTVTDNNGASASATMQVTVNAAANIAPTANAGSNKNITLPTNSVNLTGSGSDVDGTIASYKWTKISGPSAYNIASPNAATTNVSGLVEGVYQFQLTVEDNKGDVGTATVQVTVNKGITTNVATPDITPVANAGNDTTIVSPANSVTLNGSGTDADGNVVGYLWNQISGPSGSTILSNNTAIANVTNLVEGTYEFELTVTDNKGSVGKDTVGVTVALGRFAREENSLKVYPNPVHDVATLEINAREENTNLIIVITDISGKTVYRKELVSSLNDTKLQVDMSNLIKGTYVITVFFDGIDKKSVKVLRM